MVSAHVVTLDSNSSKTVSLKPGNYGHLNNDAFKKAYAAVAGQLKQIWNRGWTRINADSHYFICVHLRSSVVPSSSEF